MGVSFAASQFIREKGLSTPALVMDLRVVAQRYADVSQLFPATRVFYAVKANPAHDILALLVRQGASFEVASVAEMDLCLKAGAAPADIAFTNTIKTRNDIAAAFSKGVRLFTVDTEHDLRNVAAEAPGSMVLCRTAVGNEGAKSPLGGKFGCPSERATELLLLAAMWGLDPVGVAFHVGSQQLSLHAWDEGVREASQIFAAAAEAGVKLRVVNLGGGLPVRYREEVPSFKEYAAAIHRSLMHHFSGAIPATFLEPGRAVVAEAGVLVSSVVLAARKSPQDIRRWVYADVGRYGGLAETEGEMIAYDIRTAREGDPVEPIILAGPTCDGDDVLYQKTSCFLPETLAEGDLLEFLAAGAYTAPYASCAFNGFAPMRTYCIGDVDGVR